MHALRERIAREIAVSDELWNHIESRLHEVHFKKGEVIIPFGSVNQFSHFLASGACLCSQASKTGQSRVIWFYMDNLFDFFSATDSYFDREPTKYEIRALEDCTVVKIHKDAVDEWVVSDPFFNAFYIKRIVANYLSIFEIRSFLLTYTSEEFLSYVHDKYPQIFNRVPAKYIADFIGVTPEWYSKLKRELKFK